MDAHILPFSHKGGIMISTKSVGELLRLNFLFNSHNTVSLSLLNVEKEESVLNPD